MLCFLYLVSVPPIVTMSQSSPSSDLVVVTCHVQRFYPAPVHLSWLKNCQLIKGAEKSMSKQNSDGTYTLEAFWLVNASTHLGGVLTCKVQQEAQPPIWANLILSPAVHDKPSESPGKLTPTPEKSWATLCPKGIPKGVGRRRD